MNRFYTLILLCFATLASSSLHAQGPGDCPGQTVVLLDSLDTYTPGDITGQSANFAPLPNGATLEVIDSQAFSNNQSLLVSGAANSGGTLLLGDLTEGAYLLSYQVYVPTGGGVTFIVDHITPTVMGMSLGALITLNGDGTGTVLIADFPDFPEVDFTYEVDDWVTFALFIDLEGDVLHAILDERLIARWNLNEGIDLIANEADSSAVAAIRFEPDAMDEAYIDDIVLLELPDPSTGSTCNTAEVVSEGMHEVPELTCYGAGFQTDEELGFAGYWYSYTPATDGILQVSSCLGGADSRVWIFTGECDALLTVGINDDQCDLGSGDEWASYKEAIVTAGQTYYILWDNIWDMPNPDWELTLSTDNPAAGDFCQTAIPVQPNEVVAIFEFTGNATVAGPTIGNSSQGRNPTNYALSQWYQFTPPFDGMMTVLSCDLSLTDNRVWIYTGECGTFESLTLIDTDDDGCGISGGPSIVDSIPVTAGTRYLIEWDNGWDSDLFQWTLLYDAVGAVAVDLAVDMSEETVSDDGVFVADLSTDQGSIRMTDNDFDNVYEATVFVAENSTFEYRFANGENNLETIDTSIGDDCTNAEGNRSVTVANDDVTVDLVCFGYCVTCDLVSDVDHLTFATGISVFPNPTTGQVTIDFALPETLEETTISVYDALGNRVLDRYLNRIQVGTETVSLTHLPQGTYTIAIQSGQLIEHRMIVKQ